MVDPFVVGAQLSALAGQAVSRVGSALTAEEKSLLDFVRVGQVAPMVIIDSDIRYNPLIKDALHVLASLFTGYYMQALVYDDLLGDVKITERLDKFNPTSKPQFSQFSLESYAEAPRFGLPSYGIPSLEAYDKSGAVGGANVTTKENISEIYEDRSLAVGKTITVKLHDRLGKDRPVPVQIRIVPMTMDTESLLAAFSMGSRWNSDAERKHRVNAGELRYIADYLFKLDMIKEHQRALLNDKSGVYAALSKRRSNNMLSQILSGKQSLATASAMAIISAKTGKDLERRLGGKLDSVKTRNELFEQLGLMILVVFDPDWDQFVFYYRGSDDASKFNAAEIKSGAKKQDINVMELINTFMNKGAPSF